MINKILAYFPGSVTSEFAPAELSPSYYWFQETADKPLWIGIPKSEISESQLDLIKNLLNLVEQENKPLLSGAALAWNQFLFHDGPIPAASNEVRFIQFKLQTKDIDSQEINEALHGFFPDYIIIWVNESHGIIVEDKMVIRETAEEIQSISATFESDFFVKISFYIGKFQKLSKELPDFFNREKELFTELLNLSVRDGVYTFEKAFPILLASQLPANLKDILKVSVLEAFEEDKELMATIKVFLKSNSNASLAAKKLYVHRNTLQYRLDKFMDKTGVHLKDFDAAVVVYIASLFEEIH